MLCTGCLVLANCTNGNMSSRAVPEYGAAASARLVARGDPVLKDDDVHQVGKPYVVGGRKSRSKEDYSASIAADVPKLDLTESCRRAAIDAHSDKRMQLCLDSERRWHDQLVKRWSDFAPADRVACVNMQRSFDPSYTELLTCLEIARDAKSDATRQSWKAVAEH